MTINEPTAKSIIEAAHAAWNDRDLEAMLDWYCDDARYFCNCGAPDGGALTLYGKSDMRAFLTPVLAMSECISVPLNFAYRDGEGLAAVEVVLRHFATGHILKATYRQRVVFEDSKIKTLEEFHDVDGMKRFWDMVLSSGAATAPKTMTISAMLSDLWKSQQPLPPPGAAS